MDRAMNFIEKHYLKSVIFRQQALLENSVFIFTWLDYRHLFPVLNSAKVTTLVMESTVPVMPILCTLQRAHFLLVRPPCLQSFQKHRL